jgi:hypothetical protein
MKKRKDILRSDSCGVIPTAKGYCLLDAGFFYIMRKSVKSQNETLEGLVTNVAKKQAASLGIPVETYVGRIAMKTDRLPMTIMLPMRDIARIQKIWEGQAREWVENIIPEVLDSEVGEAAEGGAR